MSVRLEGLLLEELAIALVSSGVDLAPVQGLLDGAVSFMSVRAIGEPAVGDEGPELDEVAGELGRNRCPRARTGGGPGVSTTKPPVSSPISSAVVVVCFPLNVQSDTSRTLRLSPGWTRFKSELLPTPLWPVMAVTPLARSSRKRSRCHARPPPT